MKKEIPNLVGALVLVLPVLLLGFAIPHAIIPKLTWPFIYLAMLMSAVYGWNHKHAPGSPGQWSFYGFLALLSAALFALTGISTTHVGDISVLDLPGMIFDRNPMAMVNAFGMFLGAFVAFAGAARAAVIERAEMRAILRNGP